MKKYICFILVLSCFSSFSQVSNFTIYNDQNSNIVTNSVADFEFDTNGNVWITHGNPQDGISKFNGTDFVNYIPNIPIPVDARFADIEIDNNNNIWILVWQKFQYSYNNGCNCYPLNYARSVLFFDGTNWVYYTPTNSALPSTAYGSIKADNIGNIWFLTNQGLSKFNGSNLTVFNPPTSLLPSVSNFYENNFIEIDANNKVWIASAGGLLGFSNNIWTTHQFSASLDFDAILTISNSDIYLGTDGSGGSLGGPFYKFDGSNFISYENNYEACDLSNDINSSNGFCYLDVDSQGNLWGGYGSESFGFNEETNEYYYLGIKNITTCQNYLEGLSIAYSKLKIDNQDNLWMIYYENEGLLKMQSTNLTINEHITSRKILYPNPTTDEFIISNVENSLPFKYNIYNLKGEMTLKGISSYNEPININELCKGTYIISVFSDNYKIDNYKLVKQ